MIRVNLAKPAGSKRCKHCGEYFLPKRPTRAKFCSSRCQKNHGYVSRRPTPTETICAGCGGVFVPDNGFGPHKRFCSVRCRKSAWNSKHWSGERQREYNAQYRAANKDKIEASAKLKKYGIVAADELAKQGGRCAICGTDKPNGRGWATDHDHATGRFRGILCNNCNTGLGLFKDNPIALRLAASYLDAISNSAARSTLQISDKADRVNRS